ncbi:MAG: 16S rRNA (uracil(1498)-N(3))-methyltransferase [Alicyclobacillaceae bacterium]|nr:16S rRNA (uracil(1498)-N(3))-methyltransferase [Alicyclobacillaceae bacterium]
MQRYLVPPSCFVGDTAVIRGEDARHMARVMRMVPGQTVECGDGRGTVYRAVIEALSPAEARLSLKERVEEDPEPRVELVLLQGLPKHDKMDLIVQKATEIGVARIVPVAAARSVVRYEGEREARRLERWRRIAKEAAEQARRARIPEILPPVDSSRAWDLVAGADAALLLDEGRRGRPLAAALRRRLGPCRIALAVGPEGGWTPEEVEEAAGRGVEPVHLGPRILRTETAGLVAAAAIFYHFGEWGGGAE